ncbi:hypothetical protein AALP_AA2G136000 [Arabis alpina]|uniref:PB1 domain-containing protein n=1 Tax=Arabis alpina TaxID=50452 RepID=A0A087HH76_ARAAL|nr:hypothetical protein AALP_AA2G136000 [Arabis alpina]
MTTHSPTPTTVKFLCSYGGKIIPRHPDGKLRYQGGHTRVLSVPRSVSFTELLRKLSDIYGSSVNFRCQLPTDDLDALVTVTTDEDLKNIMEEYDIDTTAQSLKIRAFLSPVKSMTTKMNSSPPSSSSSSSSDSNSSSRSRSPEKCQSCVERSMRNNGCYVHRSPGNNQQFYLIHN